MAITVLLSFTACNAQIKNAKTESVKIYGNCGMCETTIEKAGNKKKIAKVDWNNVDDFLILSKFTVLYGANQGRKRWSSSG